MMSHRAFLTGGVMGVAAAGALTALQIYEARYVNPYRPQVDQVEIALPEQHAGLDGMRIGFITDTHVGPFITGNDLERAVKLVTAEAPDLLLLGGDYISESLRYLSIATELLAPAVAGMPLGGFGVLGNHDLNVSLTKVQEGMEASGIPILRNNAVSVSYRGTDLWICGIDDTLVGDDRPGETFAQVPKGSATVALWHEPEFAELAARQGAFLQLSGHTHGGQIRLPGIGPVGLPVHGKRYVMGLNRAAGMQIYTARGVGVYRPPLRFNCPPEVTILTLKMSVHLAG